MDASIQVDINRDIITYDSDDEMVKSRRIIPFGGLRSKKGHPIYSREDIREQYCINRKQLQVFEEVTTQRRLFGCLSMGHLPDSSPCSTSSYILSCVQGSKSSDNEAFTK